MFMNPLLKNIKYVFVALKSKRGEYPYDRKAASYHNQKQINRLLPEVFDFYFPYQFILYFP